MFWTTSEQISSEHIKSIATTVNIDYFAIIVGGKDKLDVF